MSTPTLRDCYWLRFRCPKCGIYEVRLKEAPKRHVNCLHCGEPEIELMAACQGKTALEIPFVGPASKNAPWNYTAMLPNSMEKWRQQMRRGALRRSGRKDRAPGEKKEGRPKLYAEPDIKAPSRVSNNAVGR